MAPMKIQPLDSHTINESSIPTKTTTTTTTDSITTKPVVKSRLRRLFDRQLPSVLRISSTTPAEKPPPHNHEVAVISKQIGGGVVLPAVPQLHKEFNNNNYHNHHELEPSSVCLAKMVQNFIEERDEKPATAAANNQKCGRNRCNCFNAANGNDSSDDEVDPWWSDVTTMSGDLSEVIKSLVPCVSTVERNLLADTAKIVEQQQQQHTSNNKGKEQVLKFITDGLSSLGYNAATCKSRWEKTPSYPAGEHDYIDVIIIPGDDPNSNPKQQRIIIDVDFRSEFELARPTTAYKSILQSLPSIFVGRIDRLEQILSAVSDAAKQSLKKKGMHIPPWRRSDYTRAKWMSSYTRVVAVAVAPTPTTVSSSSSSSVVTAVADAVDESPPAKKEDKCCCTVGGGGVENCCGGEFELIFGEVDEQTVDDDVVVIGGSEEEEEKGGVEKKKVEVVEVVPTPWQPPAIKRKNNTNTSCERGGKVVTGLASLLRERQ